MDITYDLIIKYLVSENKEFITKKHITNNSDTFPKKFKELCMNNYYRYGINHNNDVEGSLYGSLLTIINLDYITYSNDDETKEILKFKKALSEYKINELNIIKKICKILNINIIILNFKNEEINIYYPNDIYELYQSTIILANYDSMYEPIIQISDNKKIFNYDDLIIKNIFELEIKLNKIKYNDNLLLFVDDKNELENRVTDTENIITATENMVTDTENVIIDTENIITETDIMNTFIKEEIVVPETKTKKNKPTKKEEFTESTLSKKTKKELGEILQGKNININVDKMLKKDIIKLILQ